MATLLIISASVAIQAWLIHKILGVPLRSNAPQLVTVQRLPARSRSSRRGLPRARLR